MSGSVEFRKAQRSHEDSAKPKRVEPVRYSTNAQQAVGLKRPLPHALSARAERGAYSRCCCSRRSYVSMADGEPRAVDLGESEQNAAEPPARFSR